MRRELLLELRGRTRDDRGSSVQPFCIATKWWGGRLSPETPLSPAIKADLRRARGGIGLIVAAIAGLPLILWGAVMLIFGAWPTIVEHGVLRGMAVVAWAGIFLVSGWSLFIQFIGSPRAARKVLLAHGRCVRCGYDIAKIRAADDGCTVCPECGAAWRLEGRRV